MRDIDPSFLSEQTFYILLSLAGGQKHGYAILKDVQTFTEGGICLSTSTLYTALSRLLDQGLIERTSVDELPSPGKPRKAYRLSQSGKVVLESEVSRLKLMLNATAKNLGAGFP